MIFMFLLSVILEIHIFLDVIFSCHLVSSYYDVNLFVFKGLLTLVRVNKCSFCQYMQICIFELAQQKKI